MTSPLVAPVTVLVVDDVADARAVLAELMRSQGYRVIEAADGGQAVKAARRERPHLVLLDLNLPVLDGLEVARRLRTQPAMKKAPIVAVTAYHYHGMREAALEAGCDEYLPKPVEFDVLAEVVRRLLAG